MQRNVIRNEMQSLNQIQMTDLLNMTVMLARRPSRKAKEFGMQLKNLSRNERPLQTRYGK